MPTIKLKSSEDDIFVVDVDIANTSSTIKDILKAESVQDGMVVPLPKPVSSTVLKQAIEWATHYQDYHVTPPVQNDETEKPCCADHLSWEAAFFDLGLIPTIQLLKGALILRMEGLMVACTKALSTLVERMTPEQLSQEYNASTDHDELRQADGDTSQRAKRPGRRGASQDSLGNKKKKKNKNKTVDPVLLSECSDDSTSSD